MKTLGRKGAIKKCVWKTAVFLEERGSDAAFHEEQALFSGHPTPHMTVVVIATGMPWQVLVEKCLLLARPVSDLAER